MKKPQRYSRLKLNLAPCVIHSYRRPDNSFIIEFVFPPNCEAAGQWATGIVDAAHVFGNLFTQFFREIERDERRKRVQIVTTYWKTRQREVQQRYIDLRQAGFLHRAAIRSLVEDPQFEELRSKYHWKSAEFNATVKSFLRPIPLHQSKRVE